MKTLSLETLKNLNGGNNIPSEIQQALEESRERCRKLMELDDVRGYNPREILKKRREMYPEAFGININKSL